MITSTPFSYRKVMVVPTILIIYFSLSGSTEIMARLVARGVEGVANVDAKIMTVPSFSDVRKDNAAGEPASGPPWASVRDLDECSGLIVGSPTNFGNMAAPLKHFFDQTTAEWFKGSLAGKPGAVFTSSGAMHAGQESTLLSMMIPLLHHGMLMCGLPYTEKALRNAESGGSPYGAGHFAGIDGKRKIDENESKLCLLLGKRVAQIALRLCQGNNRENNHNPA